MRRSSQPITWPTLTNKTVRENTQTKYNQNRVASYDTLPGNEAEDEYSLTPNAANEIDW